MNSISDKYAIFIDIDGTLMGKNDDALFENLAAIQKVRSLGHKVFVSTGRSTAYLPDKINHTKNFDGIITGAGAVIKVGNKELSKTLMSNELIEKFSLYALENRLQAFLEGEENIYHFGFSDNVENEWKKISRQNLKKTLEGDVPVEKFTILGDIPPELDDIMGQECVVLRHTAYGEIIHKNRGKGVALLDTLKFLKIPLERSIAIGDSMNDYDMLKTAGTAVAMGNSTEEIKKIADIITDDVDSAGVSAALRKIFNF